LLARVMSESLPPIYPYSVEGGDQAVMQQDFDDRVDVVPVSNPNIFSQAQRISLAQTQMQLAMQAPEIHDIYEAYRRMYDALGVRDVDKLLRPQSTEDPVPKDPAQENIDALEGTQLKAFEGQNHDAHIMAHLTFGASGMVMQSPGVAGALQKHVLEHVQIKANEMAVVQFMQQTQGQQLTDEQVIELQSVTAQMIAQEMQNLKQLSEQIAGGGQQGPDPLVQLKQQELALKQQQVQADITQDQAELQLDTQKAAQKAQEFQQRLASQEKQTAARIDSAMERERLRQQDITNRGF